MGGVRGHRVGVAGIMPIFDDLGLPLPRSAADQARRCDLRDQPQDYGWIYLVVAAVLIVCAFLALNRSQLGRWVGIVAGAIGCVSAIRWMPITRSGR